MTLKYSLFENHLTSDPDDYAAHVQISSSADFNDIADHMVKQGSTVTKSDILAVLEDALQATETMLLDGRRVNFGGLVNIYPTIKGIFDGLSDSYDKNRHKIDVRACAGPRVRNTIRQNVRVEKTDSLKPMPSPVEYFDLAAGETNGIATPGNIGTIRGHRLKFNAEAADEGIFFINTADNSVVKVDLVQKNKPAELVFLVPAALTAGDYIVEVHSRIQGAKEIRNGVLDETVTVS